MIFFTILKKDYHKGYYFVKRSRKSNLGEVNTICLLSKRKCIARPTRANTIQISVIAQPRSVGARVVWSGWVGLYGRPLCPIHTSVHASYFNGIAPCGCQDHFRLPQLLQAPWERPRSARGDRGTLCRR